ncbi:IPExxxVDY family protein [Tenacibaculum amylolyticum]|uniref:IPExxxVDY family protein n=1 Tax=Tenacibaculum amylolyticum TaxID=104269 RepID=UPI0038955FBD
MQIHTVHLDDFSSNDYHILGIHTPLENYRLAYLLNTHLQLRLERCTNDIDFKNKDYEACFPLYEFIDCETDNSWFLIDNVYKTNIKSRTEGLFTESEAKVYLIPEKKRVDYFLKLEGGFTTDKANEINEVISKIPQIMTSYYIETDTLKSKEFLIF